MERFKKKARKLRAKQTSAEAALWKALRNRQLARWKFRRQHPVDRYVVDFVTIDGKLIVEVDGATHSTKAELVRDAERARVLTSLGFHIVRVTNVDVYENLVWMCGADIGWMRLSALRSPLYEPGANLKSFVVVVVVCKPRARTASQERDLFSSAPAKAGEGDHAKRGRGGL